MDLVQGFPGAVPPLLHPHAPGVPPPTAQEPRFGVVAVLLPQQTQECPQLLLNQSICWRLSSRKLFFCFGVFLFP